LEILPARGGTAPTLSLASEHIVEEVAESTPLSEAEIPQVKIVEIEPLKPTAGAPTGREGAMSKLIVFLAEFRGTEDVIGLRDLFETAFRLLVAGVEVGMIFAGQATIGFFDLLLRGAALDS